MNSEDHFIQMLSSQLNGFKQTGKNVYNFRCPYCGDSKRKKGKKRGYLYEKEERIVFYCHNCHVSKQFKWFLKDQNPTLYQEYLESILDSSKTYTSKSDHKKPPVRSNFDPITKRLPKISSLQPDHPVKKYIVSRQIPTDFHHKLFLCSKFKKFTNSLLPEKFKDDLEYDETRIIIPIYYDDNLVGYQGRAVGPSDVKYITIVLDESKSPLIYGWNTVDWNCKHFVLEGPFDSMFIHNSISVLGSSLLKTVKTLNRPKNNTVLVFDNQPRNKDIVTQMRRSIDAGYHVCVWPATVKEKDVNDMILSLVKPSDFVQTEKVRQAGWSVRITIEENTYHGLKAMLKLAEWSKVHDGG